MKVSFTERLRREAVSHGRQSFLQRKRTCSGTAGITDKYVPCSRKSVPLQLATRNSDTRNQNGIPPIVHGALRSSGQALEAATCDFFITRFGHDFSRVRVHTDTQAAESARALNALAYTVGQDVVFGRGQYAPNTQAGRRLIAHELTHVMQQAGGAVSAPAQLRLSPSGDHLEQEADHAADVVVATEAKHPSRILGAAMSRLSVNPPSIQRTAKFVDGSVSEEFNLAERLAAGQSAGNTDFVLNGTAFTAGTKWETERNALHTPGIGARSREKGGVECWFDTVPDNEGSYAMKVLKSGAWNHVVTKADLAALFPALNGCKTAAAGNATLVVNGMPTNEDQRKRTRSHEDQHVADDKAIFDDTVVPWDKRVTEAHKKHQTMLGTDVNDCERKLYTASVGAKQRPDEIVANLVNTINAKARAFHGSAAGRDVRISNVHSDNECNTVTAEAR